MKKVLKDAKTLLLENMIKLNPDFVVIKEQLCSDNKKYVIGYCTPMTKPTCTPARKALAKRFKRGIENESVDLNAMFSPEKYKQKVDRLKATIDDLYNEEDYEVLDTMYKFFVDRKANKTAPIDPATSSPINEDASNDYRKKVELLKGKIDFLYNSNHFDIIDKVDDIIGRLFPDEPDAELAEGESTKYRADVTGVRENVWSTNGKEFNSEQEAKIWLDGLAQRWNGYDMSRVVPITVPPRQPVDMNNDVIYQNFRK